MMRIAIGGFFGLAVWATSTAAFAQSGSVQNGPIGPTSVSVGASSSVYKSTVVTTGSFNVILKVKYLGVTKHSSNTYVSTSGTVNFEKEVTGMNTWGMIAGQQLDYWTKAYLNANSSIYDIDDLWADIIQTYLTQPREREADRFRKEGMFA